MSPEPASLHQLVESHNPQLLSLAQDDSLGLEILDVTNRVRREREREKERERETERKRETMKW